MESLINAFNPSKATFGRHETFILRYSWLTKGFQAVEANPSIFNSDAATVELGVGKNMVNAIRYWLRATQLIVHSDEGWQATELGKLLFSEQGWDPYLEDEGTLWLIHWLLATNAELATAWYWFFNCFHKAEFSAEEAANDLAIFVQQQLSKKHSERTVKHDINIILKMYCQGKQGVKVELEDILDTPLAAFQLISLGQKNNHYQCRNQIREYLPMEIIGFAVNEVFKQRDVSVLAISDLMYGSQFSVAVGSVFKLTEAELLSKLELLVSKYPKLFKINETAGINQLYCEQENISSLLFLRDYFTQKD